MFKHKYLKYKSKYLNYKNNLSGYLNYKNNLSGGSKNQDTDSGLLDVKDFKKSTKDFISSSLGSSDLTSSSSDSSSSNMSSDLETTELSDRKELFKSMSKEEFIKSKFEDWISYHDFRKIDNADL